MSAPTIETMARAVADELLDEKSWTQNAAARDDYGNRCDPEDPSACTWCAYGHARRLYSEGHALALWRAYNEKYGDTIGQDNNVHGREFVRVRMIELADYEAKR